MELNEDVKYIKGVGPNRVKLLNKIGIFTLKDLITYYPRDYEDRSKPKNLYECVDGEEVLIEAMAAGVPPLCIDDESFRGTVTDELNGRVFKNQEEYVNQVTEFYENKKMIDTYSKQARVQAEHCSSRSYASSVLEVYQRALKEKKEKTGLFTKIANFFKGE